ncbi:DUF6897 domain-containing protein [Paenibacillus plantiphilus]|uniref:DUF6897 domain-containing protein n=1 Tax=Paenibacillus plantiphilus TaxID=2905650 RepID=UPI001F31D4AA|nr:DUF2642 domain-containing protein [Paenibacillus plantiphilus]
MSPTRGDRSHRSHRSHRSDKHDKKGSYLRNLIGKNVKINRGGPDSLEGKLIAVQSDYIVLQTKDGIIYVNTSHVKSITELPTHKTKGWTPKYIVARNFLGVLRKLTKKFVQINSGGPEKVEGFIAEVSADSVLLVDGQDLLQIPLFHIKTVKQTGKYVTYGGGRTGGQRTGGDETHGHKTHDHKTRGPKSRGPRTGRAHFQASDQDQAGVKRTVKRISRKAEK